MGGSEWKWCYMNKDSLIFYLSQYEAIKTLSNEQLGRLFRALFEKQLQNNSKTTEKEVVLEEDIKIASGENFPELCKQIYKKVRNKPK